MIIIINNHCLDIQKEQTGILILNLEIWAVFKSYFPSNANLISSTARIKICTIVTELQEQALAIFDQKCEKFRILKEKLYITTKWWLAFVTSISSETPLVSVVCCLLLWCSKAERGTDKIIIHLLMVPKWKPANCKKYLSIKYTKEHSESLSHINLKM